MFKSALLWYDTVVVVFLLLTINKISNPFSLAADFVRFIIRLGPVLTHIFVCAAILGLYLGDLITGILRYLLTAPLGSLDS